MTQEETIQFKDAFTPVLFLAACNALGLDMDLLAGEWDLALGALSEDIATGKTDLYKAGQAFLDITVKNEIDLRAFDRFSATKFVGVIAAEYIAICIEKELHRA